MSSLSSSSRPAFVLVLLLASACAASSPRMPFDADRRGRSAEIIGPDQMGAHPDLPTAYLMVEALHSNWLRERRSDASGTSNARMRSMIAGGRAPAGENAGVQVYLDGHRLGGVELLRNIPSVSVHSIGHMNAIDAQSRYGAGHSQSVILVRSMSQRR